MVFLLALPITVVLTLVLRTPIKKLPWLLYGVALVATLLFLARNIIQLPAEFDRVFFPLMQKCIIAQVLFLVVMYTGIFGHKSKARGWLQPIRAELSIIACILALGHITSYLGSFGARILFTDASYSGFLVASFVVSCVLLALMLTLGVTSFETIRRAMKARNWRRLQSLAYLFYTLTFVHVLLCLLPPALSGGGAAQLSVGVYSAVYAVYAVLRVRRWALDRQKVSTAVSA